MQTRNTQGQLVTINLTRHKGRLSLHQRLLLSQKRQVQRPSYKPQKQSDELSEILNERSES